MSRCEDSFKMHDKSSEVLIRKVRCMLNKLMPQNFETICQDLLSLRIDDEQKLRKLIDLIYDKAVNEPAFCEQYAKLCSRTWRIHVINEDERMIRFNTLLFDRCQTDFEKDDYKDIDIKRRTKMIEECVDQEKRQQLIDELDEEKQQILKKRLGNIKFIGELYKLSRLKIEIMDLCIDTLINNDEENSYECLCFLLKSIGEKFENQTINKSKFNTQMKRLEQVVKQNKVASRIKFLIMDVLDMRKDNWKVRKLQEGTKPKTIEQVHEYLRRKKEETNRKISREMSKRNKPVKKRNDTWMHSSYRKSQQNSSDAISNLRKLQEQRNNVIPTSLGPSFALGPKNVNWSQRTINQVSSRNDSRLNDSRSSSRKSQFRGSYIGGNDDKDYELMEKYTEIIKKYVKSLQMDSLINSLYDLSTEECTHLFVRTAIDCVCESFLENIAQIRQLLVRMVIIENIIPQSQFHKGLKHHLDISEELLMEMPRFFEYIGNILSHFFFKSTDNERRSFFKQTLEAGLKFDISITIIAHLIKHAIRIKDVVEVAEKWSSGKMVLSDFSSKQNEEQLKELLIKEYNLENFINELNDLNSKSVKSSSAPIDRILSDDFSFNKLPKLLKDNLSASDNEMNKKLINAFFERCIRECSIKNQGGYHFDKEAFDSKMNMILPLKQLDDPELQLEILSTAVKKNHEYGNPKDYLINMIPFLVELKIVIADVILRWADKKDDIEQGHPISLLQLKRYIDTLRRSVVE